MKCLYKNILLSIGLSLLISTTFSQDFHLSQYWANPLNVNPALTGLFENNIRLSASYRNQWFHYNSFQTYIVAADANLFRDKLNGNYIGIGLNFSEEIEGKGYIKNTNSIFSFAYNKNIKSRYKIQNISIGFNATFTSKQLNFKDLVFGNLYEKDINFDPIQEVNYERISFMDLGIGLNYLIKVNDKHLFSIGISSMNILEQIEDFTIFKEVYQYRKNTINFNSEIVVQRNFMVIPIFLIQQQGPHQELSLGSYFKYELNKNSNKSLYLGAQYRINKHASSYGNESIIAGFRAKFQGLDIGLSYDYTISNLRKSAILVGSPEININYTIAIKKTNKPICPSF